jgi:hypothetical protein
MSFLRAVSGAFFGKAFQALSSRTTFLLSGKQASDFEHPVDNGKSSGILGRYRNGTEKYVPGRNLR